MSSSQVFLGIFAELQKFFDDAYNCYKLGEALYDENTTVLTRAVARDVFARSFNQIIEKWQFVGS
ncbi:MAG: hypothetical protein LBF97_03300, partial [Elusimicrobiota bacterium]|nr:hypothetical protein [Elusimicrobiota bacterium]